MVDVDSLLGRYEPEDVAAMGLDFREGSHSLSPEHGQCMK
jgi:hypothetical protein